MYIYTEVYIHKHIYICICICIYTYMSRSVGDVCALKDPFTSVCFGSPYTYMCICTELNMYTNMYVYFYIYAGRYVTCCYVCVLSMCFLLVNVFRNRAVLAFTLSRASGLDKSSQRASSTRQKSNPCRT